jgi:hypothetical protein
MDAEFFISRAEREVDHQHNRVILTARNKVHADGLRRCCVEVAQWANGKETIIRWAENEGRPSRIPALLARVGSDRR